MRLTGVTDRAIYYVTEDGQDGMFPAAPPVDASDSMNPVTPSIFKTLQAALDKAKLEREKEEPNP